MTPDRLADIHAKAMQVPAPWTAKAISDLLETPGAFLVTVSPAPVSKYPGVARGGDAPSAAGFAMGRLAADEAELLTLAVDPDCQRQGLGRDCLRLFEKESRAGGANRAFLEVAASNLAARRLYHSAGYSEDGIRKNYYRAGGGKPIDAILMSKLLNPV